MPSSQDADLFQSVAELLEISSAKIGRERRGRPRSSYECMQLVAPYDGRRLPTQADFERVQCHDISTGGFSFYADHPPHDEQVIAALGSVPFTFFVAKVVRIAKSEVSRRGKLLIGCEFVERLKT